MLHITRGVMDNETSSSSAVISADSRQAARTEPGFISPEDVAAYLGVKLDTIRSWRKRGQLPTAYKIGNLVRWRKDEIERWALTLRERPRRTPRLYKISQVPSNEGRG